MRHRALAFFLLLSLFLAGCDMSGLPQISTSTPTISSEATSTPESVAGRATRTPGRAATPTSEGRATAEATEEAKGDPTETAVASGPTPTVDPQELAAMREVEQATARLRGLEPKAEVPRNFITKEQLRINTMKDMEKDYPKEEAAQDAVELWLLRHIDDRDLDLFQLYIDVLTDFAAGYYDIEDNEFFVLREAGDKFGLLNRETLSHEFVHALQDQHFDLERLLPDETTEEDMALASRGVIEGDATLTAQTYLRTLLQTQEDVERYLQEAQQQAESGSTEAFDKAPAVIRESLIFPYTHGVRFVEQLFEAGGYEAINRALGTQDPVKSTEQILHPDKYIKTPRDEPKVVAMPPLTDTLGTGWKHADGATIGEFDLQILLDETGARRPERAAAGWGGGYYDFYQNGEEALLFFTITWDTTRDVDEYVTALTESFRNNSKQGDLWEDGGRYFGMKRVRDDVTLVAATNPDAVNKTLAVIK